MESKCVKGILSEKEGKRGKTGWEIGCDKEFDDPDNILAIMHKGLCGDCLDKLEKLESDAGIEWVSEAGGTGMYKDVK